MIDNGISGIGTLGSLIIIQDAFCYFLTDGFCRLEQIHQLLPSRHLHLLLVEQFKRMAIVVPTLPQVDVQITHLLKVTIAAFRHLSPQFIIGCHDTTRIKLYFGETGNA